MTTEYEIWDGEYVKKPYLALINGKEIPCWPNAGRMNACDGTGRYWMPNDNIKVRICTCEEHVEASRRLKADPALRSACERAADYNEKENTYA